MSQDTRTSLESETEFDQMVKGWLTRYGAAAVTDTIRTCELEWSYSQRPSENPSNQKQFWREVGKRLEQNLAS